MGRSANKNTPRELERKVTSLDKKLKAARAAYDRAAKRYDRARETLIELHLAQGRTPTMRELAALQVARRRLNDALDEQSEACRRHSLITDESIAASRAYARALQLRELNG
jgi:hypothetical protein